MGEEIRTKVTLKTFTDKEIPHVLMEGEVGASIELIVKDKDGNITDRIGPKRAESFVRQFLELLWAIANQFNDANAPDVRDTSNTLRAIRASSAVFDTTAAAGDATHGTVVGTGNTAPTISDYALETLIAHGVGAGQLQYSDVSFGAPAADATTSQFTITRNFANGSGGAITVNEIGLYVRGMSVGNYYYFMTIRDVIGGGINVPNGQTLTVNYRLQAVV